MSESPRRSPSLIVAFFLIAAMDIAARTRGFAGALSLANTLGRNASQRTDPDLVAGTARTVVAAAAFYPRRALCLEQSLALYVLLRRQGIGADLKVGVQTLPFSAHAWVEVNGEAVNEKQDHIEQLVTFQKVSV